VGGGFVGILVGVMMVLENARCAAEWSRILFESVAWGMCGGGFGSLVSLEIFSWAILRPKITGGFVPWGYGTADAVF
jgi:hypothetical protein